MYTSVMERKDNTSCMQVLFSFNNLYQKALDKSTDVYDHSELSMLPDLSQENPLRSELEKSHKYLGWKLIWILGLYINGKKFPSGSLKEHKWRVYV